MPARKRADAEQQRSVRIDVVRSILRIVFEHENCGILPIRAVRDGFDDAAEREVVVGNHRARSPGAWRGAARVIVTQPDDRELRQVSLLLELTELFEPDIGALLVGNAEIE